MTIIGLDPGSRFTGYGVIRHQNGKTEHLEHGVVAIPSDMTFACRLSFLYTNLRPIFLRWPGSIAVVERVFLGKSADSAFKLGHARGVCLALAGELSAEVVEYAPKSVKKIVTGSGAAEKEHVQMVVMQILKIQSTARTDASDALALALCYSQESDRLDLLKRMKEFSL